MPSLLFVEAAQDVTILSVFVHMLGLGVMGRTGSRASQGGSNPQPYT